MPPEYAPCAGGNLCPVAAVCHRCSAGIGNVCSGGSGNQSVCGDSVIAYNMAYSQVMETLADVKITERAELIRRIALEMERIAIHIGDMGAIAGDIAYQMGASIFGVTRTLVINT